MDKMPAFTQNPPAPTPLQGTVGLHATKPSVGGNTPLSVAPGPRTLEQLRAAFAWNCIEAIRRQSAKDRDEYRDLIRKLPAMIQTNGLGQALAFLLVQKGGKRALYNNLQTWLCEAGNGVRPVYPNPTTSQGCQPTVSETPLMERLTQGDSRRMRVAEVEVLALAGWLKRFAEASELQETQAKVNETKGTVE